MNYHRVNYSYLFSLRVSFSTQGQTAINSSTFILCMVDLKTSYIPDCSKEHGIGRISEIGGSLQSLLMHVYINIKLSWMLCYETI